MNFWDHVDELRNRFLFLFAIFLLASVASFFYMDEIMKFLQTPLAQHNIKLYYREPAEKFFTYFRATLSCALFALVPAAAFQVSRFVSPALTDRERRVFRLVMCGGVLLFYAGALFAWGLVVPFALEFFINFARGDGILPLWGISDYVGLVLALALVVGVSFEFPMVLLALFKSKIVSAESASRARRYVIPIIFIVAAIITPPDVITQVIVGVLLWGMFEITLLIGRSFQ